MIEVKNNENFIKKNYKKILTAAGVVTIAGVSYVICKRYVGLKTDNHTLMAACSEGLFDEAIATTTRKLNYRQDRMLYIERQIEANPNDTDLAKVKEKLISEIEELSNRLDLFSNAQEIYRIEESVE